MTNKTQNTNIIFFGTPDVAARVLESLHGAGYHITTVVTNPDAPVGRKHTLTPPPVKVVAEKLGLTVVQPDSLRDLRLATDDLPSVGIVVAYGKIIPQTIIDSFLLGMLNIHYSLLPKFRGASPVEHSILSGDTMTGVTIQKLVFKLDAGPILGVREVPISDTVTTPELKDKLTESGIDLLLQILPKYFAGEITPVEQDDSLATHCGKIDKTDGELFPTDNDITKWRKYRAYFGWPGVFYFDDDGKRNKVTLAAFENGKFVIKKIIPEGKKEISL